MTSMYFGLLMFVCAIPVLIFLYFSLYPRKWINKPRVFGVNNRPEFKTEKSSEFIDIVVYTHRKQANVIGLTLLIIAIILLFLPGFTIKMIAWSIYIYVSLFAILVPYALGNSEMKKYKKCLGIVNSKVLYADLKNAGNIHSLNVPVLIITNIFSIALVTVTALIDANIIPVELGIYNGTFICTAFISSILITNLIAMPFAFMVDNSRNNVISENSDINANYNRARKKIFADFIISLSWCINVVGVLSLLVFIFGHSEIHMVLILGFFLLLLLFSFSMYAVKKLALDKKYMTQDANLIEDDDDSWVLGIFYYNPKDKRLTIEKRVGMGWTVNIAHPVGKHITMLGILSVVGSLVLLIWIGMMATTPIKVINGNDYVICHQLWDEYRIDKNEIVSTEYGNLNELQAVRVAGTGMENVAKGTFSVSGVGKCKFFLNPMVGKYIKIVTEDRIYYISDDTLEATEALYESIK